MREIRDIAGAVKSALKAQGAASYSLAVSQIATREFNAENGDFSLLRTVLSQSASVRVISGGRLGVASCNDVSDEGLSQMVSDALAAARSADVDPAYAIAPFEGRELFRQGAFEPDAERFYQRISELLEDIARDYPKIAVMLLIASHTQAHTLYANSNGTEFEEQSGSYDFGMEFAAREGEKVTSIDDVGLSFTDLGEPLIEQGSVRRHLRDTQNSLDAAPVAGKFTGTLILTPECLESFLGMLIGNYASDSVILDGTSLWLNRVGEQVAGSEVTVSFRPEDPRIVAPERYTSDGFRARDVVFLEKGVLKTHLLGLYAANKTGRPVTKNPCSSVIMEAGSQSLDALIERTERGLLVGSFSGGQPGANGEFSGVAKNSFLIENGKRTRAVTETMISGNLGELFQNVVGVSKELLCDGSSVLPYLAAEGAVISGK